MLRGKNTVNLMLIFPVIQIAGHVVTTGMSSEREANLNSLL